MKNWTRAKPSGLSLIETIVFIAIVTVSMLATLKAWSTHVKLATISEQRRTAMVAAEQKMDEIRSFIGNYRTLHPHVPAYNPLDQAFIYYGPPTTPTGTANPSAGLQSPCCFNVPGLVPVYNTQSLNYDAIGNVTIINDEAPDATAFGIEYDGTSNPRGLPGNNTVPFGCNLYGDNYVDPYNIITTEGTFPIPKVLNGPGLPVLAPFLQGTTSTLPSPLPLGLVAGPGGNVYLDLNYDKKLETGNPNVGVTSPSSITSGFVLLPVDVTIRWTGPSGEVERVDLFAILSQESMP
jgi:type II secretory pathway pseudopilin PulG